MLQPGTLVWSCQLESLLAACICGLNPLLEWFSKLISEMDRDLLTSGFVARRLQIAADMLPLRASPEIKISPAISEISFENHSRTGGNCNHCRSIIP